MGLSGAHYTNTLIFLSQVLKNGLDRTPICGCDIVAAARNQFADISEKFQKVKQKNWKKIKSFY
jgi:hypothetical protein